MYSLMIVDDEEKIRNGLKKYFPWNELGFEVLALAANGEEALSLAKTLSPDVMLLDIKMPVMDGVQLVARMREERMECRIVFLTGYTDYALMRSAIQLGVKDYVQKPVETEEIREIFRRLRKELDSGNPDGTSVGTSGKYRRIVQDIKDYIEEHYAFVQLKDLEELTQYSRFYVSKLFQQETGMQFSDYLRDFRLQKAAEILKSDYRIKVYEVGDLVGYQNYKSFSKAFFQKFGVTPSEYRRDAGK